VKKVVALCIAAGFVAGCANHAEYTFGDALRVHVERSEGEGERALFAIRARYRGHCKEREAKLALAFRGMSPLGFFLRESATEACAV